MMTEQPYSPEELGNILADVDLLWFTYYLKGEPKRYVVAVTSNKERSLELLASQANYYDQFFDTLTLGWRTTPDWAVMIDIGTATDDLNEALELWRKYLQYAVHDSLKGKDIVINY